MINFHIAKVFSTAESNLARGVRKQTFVSSARLTGFDRKELFRLDQVRLTYSTHGARWRLNLSCERDDEARSKHSMVQIRYGASASKVVEINFGSAGEHQDFAIFLSATSHGGSVEPHLPLAGEIDQKSALKLEPSVNRRFS
jgi:hypothetical protein